MFAGAACSPICVVLLAAALAACSHRPAPPTQAAAAVPIEPATAKARVREMAKEHCGTCHQSTRPTAKPAALAIYNLDADDWSATLSAAQLRGGFTRRLNGRIDDEQRALLRDFVEHEAALRSR